MRPAILLTAMIGFVASSQAQYANLDINNIRARINADGTLFNDYGWLNGSSYQMGFEAPKNSGKHPVFAGSMWIGGVDGGGNLRLSGQTYKQSGSDFWPGPLDTMNLAIDSLTSLSWNKVWKINRSTIDSCKAGSFGSSLPQNILTWPGSGTSNNNAKSLAPYNDKNSNGVYEPLSGECPCIKGDQAVYFIFNDVKNHTESGGTAIGLEIHGMAYAFDMPFNMPINNSIFVNYQIINRSAITLDSVYLGNWTGFDIGGAVDDYVGSDVMRGAYFGYNGDSSDGDFQGALGYHDTLGAAAVVFLQGPYADIGGTSDVPNSVLNSASASGIGYGDGIAGNERSGMSKFVYYKNNFSVTGNPSVPGNYYNYLSGLWKDNTPFTYDDNGYGGNQSTSFMFPGASDQLGYGTDGNILAGNWSEMNANNGLPAIPGDRTAMGSSGPFRLEPGAVNCISYAYVFAQGPAGGTNLQSVAVLQSAIDTVKEFFTTKGLGDCGCNSSSGPTSVNKINKLKKDMVLMYPNPVRDRLYVKLNELEGKNIHVQLIDIAGKVLKQDIVENQLLVIDIKDLAPGMYLLNLNDGGETYNYRFIKN